jgi:NADP-dependent 3-hydroxy acid dehydrogenase YdfG
LVTGASRRFGRAVATTFSQAGTRVVGVGRDRARLDQLRAELGDGFTPVAADAADPVVAGQLIDAYRPRTLVLAAGTSPLARPLQRHTWETFSRPPEQVAKAVADLAIDPAYDGDAYLVTAARGLIDAGGAG